MSVVDSSCAGWNAIKLYVQTNFNGYYSVEVNEIDTSTNSLLGNLKYMDKPPLYYLDTVGIIPDTIAFPTVYFKGGRKCLITLSLQSNCGNFDFNDTVSIPFGAYITFERPTVYANPVHGARTVQLHGYVNSADSFSWSPPTWLNRTDTLVVISTPEDSISYVLTAYQGSCVL